MNPEAPLDDIFLALSDPTRRAILERLAQGDLTVADLVAPANISQPAISKHLKMLERAGLVERRVDGVRRPAHLTPAPLAEAVDWLAAFADFWPDSFDRLDALLTQLQTTASGVDRNDPK